MRPRGLTACALLVCGLAPGLAVGQALPSVPPGPLSNEPLRVFLDCNTFCDGDFIRREITYVSWVRDRQDADVHLIITGQGTGGGGREFTLRYIGLRAFQGADDELKFTTQQSDTQSELRQQQTQRIGLGLARYAARSTHAGRLRLTFDAPDEDERASGASSGRDPWNLWVFTLSASANINSESQFSSRHFSGSFRARRVTEDWKLGISIRGNRSTNRFELDSGETIHSKRSDYTVALLAIKSLGEHWSFGLNGGGRRSSRDNYDYLVRLAPGIEYDVFPYKESSQRQLVLVYEVAMIHANYHEETIYSKFSETRPAQSFTAAVEAVQPWGGVDGQLNVSNYLDRWSQNRISLEAGLNLRVVRGLNLNLGADYSRVRDQLSLAKEGASDDEVLLQLKQLKTSYTFSFSVGLNYTFGSKFNNVVNPRFGSSHFDF